MHTETTTDYYEVLQLSPNADPDTIQRVYRLLAQRYHPDNQETGNAGRFRAISEAYAVLNDPERRAQYDVAVEELRRQRWRLVENGTQADNDFALEQRVRLTVLEVLYTRRRSEPQSPGLSLLDLEQLTGRPREHLEFTIWYLVQKEMLTRGDSSNLAITARGADFLEQNYVAVADRRRLPAAQTL